MLIVFVIAWVIVLHPISAARTHSKWWMENYCKCYASLLALGSERASYNGSIEASQASDVGSIPIARSINLVDSVALPLLRLENGANWTEFCTQVGPKFWGEPLSWHSFLGHSFRFHKSVLASPSRRRGLGKGTAFESPSPAVL